MLVSAALSEGKATLIAAVVAAVAGVGTLVINTVSGYRREIRDAQREALAPHLATLADAIHQVVATSFTQVRVANNVASAERWRTLGKKAAGRLEQVRLQVRYPLPGLDGGFRNLIRVPDWVGHRRNHPGCQELLKQADLLAQALHKGVQTSWRTGRPPGAFRRRIIARRVKKLREAAPIGPLP